MNAIFGMGQGVSTVLLALGVGALALGIFQLSAGQRRNRPEERPRRRGIAIALIVVGVLLGIVAGIALLTALTAGA
ncbi:hypothetical protein ABIB37_001347 [Agrococcus sp. UYP10]|uniref:hypothetical protein n=1 Tax=Agrococcus sp. UYP10 TaxID=1756355 RepID=UPI0033927F92